MNAPRISSSMLETPALKASSCDAHLLAILDAPLRAGDQEWELAAALSALPIFDQRALHTRLANPRGGDRLAERFAGLLRERRDRLLAFLGDTKRRAAIAR